MDVNFKEMFFAPSTILKRWFSPKIVAIKQIHFLYFLMFMKEASTNLRNISSY